MIQKEIQCPLCQNSSSLTKLKDQLKRNFYSCPTCFLIFADKQHLPSQSKEKERYQLHENSIENNGYVSFLTQAIEPALNYINAGMKGLDYGCGPSPTLGQLLQNKAIECLNYDPFFFPERPNDEFDFIFATECFEHFFEPRKEINTINSLLKPGGYLIIMTTQWQSQSNFANWHYTNDFTHVAFYHRRTMNYIAEKFAFELLDEINNRIVIFRKKGQQ